jgi:hypothetical protein
MWANVWYYLATQVIVLAASFGLSLCFESPFIRLEKLWIGALLQAFLPQKEKNGKVNVYQTAKALDDTIETIEKEQLEQRYANGTIEQSYASGTVEQRYANGTMEQRYANGTMDELGIEKYGLAHSAQEDKINEKINHSNEEKNNLEVTNTTKLAYCVEATEEIVARSSDEQCITVQSSAIDEEDRGVFGLEAAEVSVEISPTYQETQKNHKN